MRRWVATAAVKIGVAAIGSSSAVGQRTEVSKDRLPFQVHLTRVLNAGVADAEASVNAPFLRRIEILSVNSILALGEAPEDASSTCVVRNVNGAGPLTARLPIILKRPLEPIATGPIPPVVQWFASQPTLLHVFPNEALECRFSRFPAGGLGSITWTISGFTEFVQGP